MSPLLKATSLLAPAALAAVVLDLPRATWRWPPVDGMGVARTSARLQVPPATREFCGRAAFLLYDVTWAVACDAVGGDSECTLPDDAAARVNAALAEEERRCVAVELQIASGTAPR